MCKLESLMETFRTEFACMNLGYPSDIAWYHNYSQFKLQLGKYSYYTSTTEISFLKSSNIIQSITLIFTARWHEHHDLPPRGHQLCRGQECHQQHCEVGDQPGLQVQLRRGQSRYQHSSYLRRGHAIRTGTARAEHDPGGLSTLGRWRGQGG